MGSTELRVYITARSHGGVDWFMTGVGLDGQVTWLTDGSFTPGGNVSLSPESVKRHLGRCFRMAVSEALRGEA